MAVNNEIWMDSGAMVSMIPEQDIFLGAFDSSDAITDNGDGTSKIRLNDDFIAAFSLVENLYRGCQVEFYLVSDETFVDKTIITANDGNTITVPNSVLPAIITNATADDYYGVIKHLGAPVPAPKGSGTSTLQTATITTAGDDLLASQAIVSNTAITGVSGLTSTGAELQLTLSSASTPVTFAAESGTNYDTGYLVIYLANSGGDRTLAVAFNCTAGTTHPATGFDEYVEVNVADSTSAVNMARAVQTALANQSVTVTRVGAVLTITNDTGGYVNSGVHMTKNITATPGTLGGVTLGTDTDGGIVTAVEITNAGSSVSGSGNLTITSAAGTDAVLALAAGSSGNPRLLSDTWIGLTDSVTVPQTQIEMKQIALNSGTRNMAYQFKGAETTSGGSFSLSANNFSWLYYALGSKTIAAANTAAINLTNIDGQTTNGEFYSADNAGGNLAGTNFIFDSDTVSDTIHRVEGNTICPPWNVLSGTNIANVKSLSHTLTNKITYTFTENNSDDLPSFALEYTLRKPSLSTVATDSVSTTTTGHTTDLDGSAPTTNGTVTRNLTDKVYSKIYPGCQVESLNITADAGQEVKMTVNFNSKNTFTAPNNYDTANNTTDLHDWVNFGSMQGGQANIDEGQLRPFFFSDGVIEMFGQEYLRIENMTLDISNSLQPKRFIGRYDKNSQIHIPGQRVYNLSFTGLVTDNVLFEELRNNAATSLSGTDGHQLKITFKKDLSATAASDETVTMIFKDYMVTTADFPLTNDKGPITVNWTIQPLELHSCTHATNWIIQG